MRKRLEEIKQSVGHDLIHNDGMPLSVSLIEINWLIEQAERAQELETYVKTGTYIQRKLRKQNRQYHKAINEIKELIPIKYEDELELSSALISIAKTIEVLESDES